MTEPCSSTHPVRYWDVAYIIRAAVKYRAAALSLVSDRAHPPRALFHFGGAQSGESSAQDDFKTQEACAGSMPHSGTSSFE
jgi:hypothetical protein